MSEENKKEQEGDKELENQNPEITTEIKETANEEPDHQSEEVSQDEPSALEEETSVNSSEAPEKDAASEIAEESPEETEKLQAETTEPAIEEPQSEAAEPTLETESISDTQEETTEEETPEEETNKPEEPEAKEIEASETDKATDKPEAVTEESDEATTEIVEPSTEAEAADEPKAVEEQLEQPEEQKDETDKTQEETVPGTADNSDASDETTTPAEPVEASEEETTETESEEEDIDYSGYTREELLVAVEELSKMEKFSKAQSVLGQILPLFNRMEKERKEAALNKFILDGGAEDDFEFARDAIFNSFDASVRVIRDRRASYIREREASKDKNYEKKLAILDRLRGIIDGPEASTNINPIKEIQLEWKAIGPVPNQHNRTLWANYNALLDRFYNNRHILFELKELDRKKNQLLKEELCTKAEALGKVDNVKVAIVQLNELHEEYKKVGPVPREVQETLWQRFKAASDVIYKERKVYLESLKGELQENLLKKRALAEEIKTYITFDSDRINDWNATTKVVISIQKKWEALGGLPREHAKEVNKDFWSSFKTFFSRKNDFFKKLEGLRKENLEAKQKLVEEARVLKDNQDWDKTSDQLKGLQRKWKDIGPVPEKFRNSIYADFKAACDEFFNNKRANSDKEEESYVLNLKNKEDFCAQIEGFAKNNEGVATDLDGLVTKWKEMGFVPKSAIKKIEERFQKALAAFVNGLEMPEEDKEGLLMKVQLSGMAKGPGADRNIQKKEGAIRRQIKELEDNVNLWNTNLAFFANSKTADKLKKEFDEKIEKAEEQIIKLKKQLRLIRSI